MRANSLETAHGILHYPCFLPDATRGVVRSVGSGDMASIGVSGLMVNALHLSRRPGTSVLARSGGVHGFMGWDRPISSDSGGYQIHSLISEDAKLGSVSDKGFVYRFSRSEEKRIVTPEKSIKYQFEIGSDIMFCLDVCTHPDDGDEAQLLGCKRTVEWAKRCKIEFASRVSRLAEGTARPLLFAVVQGGASSELRSMCAHELMNIGFDGYGFGGWPIDEDGGLVDAVGEVAGLLPNGTPKFALGIGKPESLVSAYLAGYGMLDCSIPTRDARRKRIFVFSDRPKRISFDDSTFYHYIYLQDKKHLADAGPLDETCDCPCCRRFSKAYLYHLFKLEDPLAYRLATIHNLRFMVRLTDELRRRSIAP